MNVAVVQNLGRLPKVRIDRVESLSLKQVAGGVSLMSAAIKDHALKRPRDKDLDRAVEGATYRFAADNRLWGRKSSSEDISPLVAATNALFIAAGMRQKGASRIRPPRLAS